MTRKEPPRPAPGPDPALVNSLILHVAACRSPETDDREAAAAFERLRLAMTTPGFMEKVLSYPPTIASFLRQFNALKEFDSRPLLPKIRTPTLIVNCTADPSTPVRYAEELCNNIPDSRLLLLEGDHLIARACPGRVVAPALEFIADVDRNPAGG